MENNDPKRQAALERLEKARAEVSAKMPLMTGRPTTPEEKQAFQAATAELAAASQAAQPYLGDTPDADIESMKADLASRTEKKQ